MYERLLNKEVEPTINEINSYIGSKSVALLEKLDKSLNSRYDIVRDLKFPYGNSYGWGFKYSHKKKHLCYIFFEQDVVTAMIQIGNSEVAKLNEQFSEFLPRTKKLWEKRYPCGDGGFIHYRIFNEEELDDVLKLISLKKK